MLLRSCSGAFQKCEPNQIQNQIKAVFMLNVAAISSTEKGQGPVQTEPRPTASVTCSSLETNRPKVFCFWAILFAKSLKAWFTNAYDCLTIEHLLRPKFSPSWESHAVFSSKHRIPCPPLTSTAEEVHAFQRMLEMWSRALWEGKNFPKGKVREKKVNRQGIFIWNSVKFINELTKYQRRNQNFCPRRFQQFDRHMTLSISHCFFQPVICTKFTEKNKRTKWWKSCFSKVLIIKFMGEDFLSICETGKR